MVELMSRKGRRSTLACNASAQIKCGVDEGEQAHRQRAEQVFGGITTRLWDDPFEWTLPEKLNTPAAVLDYLSEVEQISRKGFAFFETDEDLLRKIPAPVQLKSVFEILLSTIARAEHFQGRAFAVFQMISDEKLPRI